MSILHGTRRYLNSTRRHRYLPLSPSTDPERAESIKSDNNGPVKLAASYFRSFGVMPQTRLPGPSLSSPGLEGIGLSRYELSRVKIARALLRRGRLPMEEGGAGAPGRGLRVRDV